MALDDIAVLHGCAGWDNPEQLVRDIGNVKRLSDTAIRNRRIAIAELVDALIGICEAVPPPDTVFRGKTPLHEAHIVALRALARAATLLRNDGTSMDETESELA